MSVPRYGKRGLSPVSLLLAVLAGMGGAGTDAIAANRFAVANTAWNLTSTWSATSGGAAGASVPVAGDDVFIGETATVRTVTIPAGYAAAATSVTIGNATAVAGGSSLTLSAGTSSLTTSGNVTINRPSNSTTNLLSIGAGAVTVAGSVTLAGTNATTTRINRINITTGTLDIAGDLVFIAGSAAGNVLDMSGGAGRVNLAGAFTATVGTLTPGTTSTFNYDGSVAQTVRIVSSINYCNLHLNNSNVAGATLSAAIATTRVTCNLRIQSGILNNGGFAIASAGGGDEFEIASGARFNLTGTSGMPSGFTTYAIAADSTTSFQGGNQTVAAVSVTSAVQLTYGHVIAQGGSTKTAGVATPPAALNIAGDLTIETGTTFTAMTNNPIINVAGSVAINGTGFYIASNDAARALTVGGNFTVGGTYTGNVAPLNIAGNFTRTGTFTSSTGLVTLNGAAATAQTVTGATTITNLQINNTGSPGGVTLANNVTVGTLLTLTGGVVTTGGNTLITSANCPGSISRAGGHINGNLQLRFNTGAQSCAYHVGDSAAANYTPVVVTFTNVSTAGGLIGSTTAGDYADAGTPLDTAHSVNRYWTLALPGAGALAFTGSYSTAFTYLTADNDPATTASAYVIARGAACGPPCTWTLQTVSGTPTTTSATATGITTSFGVYVIGRRRVAQFGISVPGGTVSTCNAASITITAQDGGGATATNYTGTVNISTSTSDGDWSLTTGNGMLTNAGGGASGVADDGLATYAFNTLDLGVVTLSLSNVKVNSNVTVTVVDNVNGLTSSNSTAIQFRGNAFTIVNDTVQVAGRNQGMTVTRDRGAGCSETLAEYAGSKPLKAWYTADADHPSGAAAPAITGASPAMTTSAPGANNLTLNFTAGAASFTLTTADVGKYAINLRDDAAGNVDGASPTITTRPFALVVSAIRQGGANNPGGSATAGGKFIAAADTFQATVGAYLWNAAADTTPEDGAPDAAATLAQITGAGAAPSYRWTTTLSAASPYTPAAGSLGTLGNGTQTGACPTGSPNCFSSGVATPTNLSYTEVGSFTLAAGATNFLNSGINLTAIVFDNSGTPARNGVVGRFHPDSFALTASSVTPACAGGAFTYMGQPNLGYTIGIEARNKSGDKTSNYFSPGYTTGAVTLIAENGNNGTDLSSRLPAPAGSWSAGAYSFSTTTATFSRPGSPDGPYDTLQIGVTVTDADGPVLAARDMNPATSGDCVAATNCTAKALAAGATTIMRFGRLVIGNVHGSQLVPLKMQMQAQYWASTNPPVNDKFSFVTNTADSCTTIAAANIAMSNYQSNLNACESSLTVGGFTGGRSTVLLSAPGAGNNGSVDLTVNLGAGSGTTCIAGVATPVTGAGRAYLQGNWTGGTYSENPAARARFGVYRGAEEIVHIRENF